MIKKTIIALALPFALQFFLIGSVNADQSLRCGSKLIDVGDSMEEVRKHCGKPTYSSVDDQVIHAGNHAIGTTPVTTWKYRQSGSSIYAVLVFDVDKLRSIEYIDKMDDDF